MSTYRNEEYRRGYEAYDHRYCGGQTEFDGDYDYRSGWDEARRQELEDWRLMEMREERRMAEARRHYEETLSEEQPDNMEEE